MNTIIAHLRLMRPANIITAIADILAGFAISGAGMQIFLSESQEFSFMGALIWLIISTIGLYGGGIVFNDVFDAKLDRIERPERPIPSGKASVTSASLLGGILLLIGFFAAWQVSTLSLIIAILVGASAILYNAWGKHQLVFGPINMGLCRGGNLLLGVSVVPAAIQELWFLALIPIIYIAAITMISRGEVHGGNKSALIGGAVMYGSIILSLLILTLFSDIVWWQILPFIILFACLIFPPLIKALKKQEPHLIGKAVQAGVLSLIVFNAALSAVFAGAIYGVVVLLLLPISMGIANYFSVT